MNKIISILLISCFVFTNAIAQKKKDVKSKYELNKEYSSATGLKFTFLKFGTGALVMAGDKVSVNYTGKLTNDTVFDSSYPRKQTFDFKVGQKQAIAGWDEGLQLMHVGDSVKLVIPPSLGYGDKAVGSIPSNSILIFTMKVESSKAGVRPFEITKKDTVKLASGVKYLVVSKGKGDKLNDGDLLTVHYIGMLPEGKIFDASADRGDPLKYNLGKGLKGLDEGISKMLKGGKARIFVPYMLGFGEQGRPGLIPPKTDLIFDVELINVKPKPVIVQYNVKGKDTVTTASGLKYIIVKDTAGPKAAAGSTVMVHYSGYLVDGKSPFDSSIERDAPIEVQVGAGRVIKGWDEALQLMSVGDKFRLIIPYTLGYGEQGSPPVIPAKSTLIFDCQMVSIISTPVPSPPKHNPNDGHNHDGHDHK